ncbi:MAG TPA: hypothetical protein VLR26_16940 [Frankiaceae bacterium]|nr:hypothetical protein [Frankiaceae bacterium]
MTPPGSPVAKAPGRFARLFGRRLRAGSVEVIDDGTLVPLGRAFEVERGDAAVLDEIAASGRDLARPVLLRHVFRVLGGDRRDDDGLAGEGRDGADVDALLGGLEVEGYAVARPDADTLTASSTVLLTPLSAAQARARMTGLTTRHPVDYLGWEAFAPSD